MIGLLNRYRKESTGATAVEFALIALPVLLLTFGIIESGRLAWTMNGVRYAVEETSRYASLNSGMPVETLYDYAQEKLSDMLIESAPLQISSQTYTTGGADFVEVSADYAYTTMLAGFLPESYGTLDFHTRARKPVIN